MESREREGERRERERGERGREGNHYLCSVEMRFDDEIVTESKRTKSIALPNERSSFRTVCGPD